MKVWKRIRDLAELAGERFDTKDKVQSWMYANRVTPCDIEEQFKILGDERMNQLCGKHKLDCYPCMEEYLELDTMNPELLKESE